MGDLRRLRPDETPTVQVGSWSDDWYLDPKGDEWVYKWSDERIVAATTKREGAADVVSVLRHQLRVGAPDTEGRRDGEGVER